MMIECGASGLAQSLRKEARSYRCGGWVGVFILERQPNPWSLNWNSKTKSGVCRFPIPPSPVGNLPPIGRRHLQHNPSSVLSSHVLPFGVLGEDQSRGNR